MIEIDPASPTPRYLQIVQQIRRLVALGALRAGDRLPTVRELAVLARVNRNTAARAVQQLEAEGLVHAQVGQGTFVKAGPEPADRASRERRVDEMIDGLLVEAHTLGMPLEELGWRLSRRIDSFRKRREEESTQRERGPGPEEGT
jgi:GntR family transcriptional regulator